MGAHQAYGAGYRGGAGDLALREMRPQLLRAAELISTHQAERRVLMLENPGLPGTGYITSSLYSGIQIILPGEVAGAHRHASNAMRFIIEGTGAYSTIEGERVPMQPGDFVLTPYWGWHDHGHAGREPVIWLDALDNPFAQFFGTMFRENYPHKKQAVTLTAGIPRRVRQGLMPSSIAALRLSAARLSVRSHARYPRQACKGRAVTSFARHQDALRESDHRRQRVPTISV